MPNAPSSAGSPLLPEEALASGQGAFAALVDRLHGWPDSVAVEHTSRLCAAMVESGGADLRKVRRLDDLGRALHRVWASEAALESSDRASAERAAQAQAQLRESLTPRVEEAQRARVRAEVRQQFDVWADPYATDTTGEHGLAAMEAALGATRLEQVRAALAEMRAAGEHHDALDGARQHTIARRVAARTEWNEVAAALLRELPRAVQVQLCARLPTDVSEGFDEDAWFDRSSEP